MDLDALLAHYFGATRLDTLDDDTLGRGLEKLGTDFGVEREPGRRFALWSVLHALGEAPDPAIAFEDPAERRAAQDYARAAERAAAS